MRINNGRRCHRPLVIVIALTLASACIDDPTLVSDDPIPLSQEDAELLGLQVWRRLFEASLAADTDPTAAGVNSPAAAPVTFSASADTTFACAFGGSIESSISIAGAGDDQTGEAHLTLDIRQTHRGCVEGEGDDRFTLDGRPDVDAVFDFTLDGSGTLTLAGSIQGGIQATANGRSGLCAVAISFSGHQDSEGVGQYGVAGTMCGAVVDESVDVS